jgi:ribonuclease HI
VVEYEALINSLHISAEVRVQWLYICGDSELIVNQVMGSQIVATPAWWHTARR